MRRSTVMGFTEAELGFVLATVFAVLTASAATTRESLRTRSDSLQRRADSVSSAFAAYKDSVKKRSSKTPRCSERGERPDPIADVRILGANSFDIGGDRLSFADVEARFASQIARSGQLGCKYLIRAVAVRGVDSPDYSAAVGSLSTRFDVTGQRR